MSDVSPELKFTYEDYLHMPEDRRYELIDGDLLMTPAPSPYHQIVCARIQEAIRHFVDERRLNKRKLYARYGVREYWIVDPDAKTIEVLYREGSDWKSAQTFASGDRLASRLLQDFRLDLSGVFKPLAS